MNFTSEIGSDLLIMISLSDTQISVIGGEDSSMVNILFQRCARLAAILSTESANNLEAASKSDQNSTKYRDSSRHYNMRISSAVLYKSFTSR
jgi:hypothetical protein